MDLYRYLCVCACAFMYVKILVCSSLLHLFTYDISRTIISFHEYCWYCSLFYCGWCVAWCPWRPLLWMSQQAAKMAIWRWTSIGSRPPKLCGWCGKLWKWWPLNSMERDLWWILTNDNLCSAMNHSCHCYCCVCRIAMTMLWLHDFDDANACRSWFLHPQAFMSGPEILVQFSLHTFYIHSNMEVSIVMAVPQNGWFIREYPIKIDDLGVCLF